MKIAILLACIGVSCCILKKDKSLFRLQDAWYQSWMKSENERGTTITIVLNNVQPGVELDSIIFNGQQLPSSISKDGEMTILTSILNVPTAKISTKSITIGKPDQLLYKYKGKRYFYIIKDFRRKEMKYFK